MGGFKIKIPGMKNMKMPPIVVQKPASPSPEPVPSPPPQELAPIEECRMESAQAEPLQLTQEIFLPHEISHTVASPELHFCSRSMTLTSTMMESLIAPNGMRP